MNNNNKSQFFRTREAISDWLDEYNIKNYTINNDLSIDVKGNVDISSENLEIIPIRFGNVAGNFWCAINKLKLLIGSPKTVGGNFYCGYNQIINLIGSPEVIGGSFSCYNNNLVNLIGSPKSIGGNFFCDDNKLTSLLEIINCDFKQKIYFNINENNFQQKTLIQILKKYYNNKHHHYVLAYNEFSDIVKPQIEKEILQQKLNKDKLNDNKTINKSKNNFL